MLLARHVPTLLLDRRELFTPTEVDGYVRACRVCPPEVVDPRPVEVDELDERWPAGTHLRFVTEEDRRGLLGEEVRRAARRGLSPRLGRVGLVGRLIDALFLLSVWFRPTTPHRTAPAAATKAGRLGLQGRPVCYGRTIRAGEWIVLHYAWFYVMNDWRSGYRGLNDHEADWEQAWIFCDPADRRPVWIAATNHDHAGPELRRHWADPEVAKEGEHPVLHAAAGSHALFFRPGDYVSRIDVPALRWVLRLQRAVQRWLGVRDAADERGLGPALGVPFVDSAGGDGRRLAGWDLRRLGGQPWVERYRGLWGLDTGDPLQGERGPSGPKFDRKGEVRASWADPLAFAGLHGTPPPSAAAGRVNLEKLDRALADLGERIRERGRLLPLAHQTGSTAEMAGERDRLTELLRQRCELEDLRDRLEEGRWHADGIRDHLRHPAVPLASADGSGRVLEAWAALSVPLALLAAAAVLLLDEVRLGVALPLAALLTWPVEYLAKRRYRAAARLLTVEVVLVAFVAFAVDPLVAISRHVLGVALVAAAGLLLVANARGLAGIGPQPEPPEAPGPGRSRPDARPNR